MTEPSIKTHADGIWISESKEIHVVKMLIEQLNQAGFESCPADQNLNYGLPYIFQRGSAKATARLVDSVLFSNPECWTDPTHTLITDNVPLMNLPGRVLSVVPEFWSIWHFDPVYQNRTPTVAYNCFMNRCRGDRSTVFYQLIKRDILKHGLVSYNCLSSDLQDQFVSAEFCDVYKQQHMVALDLVPYNTVESHGTLEQCIIDSRISLVLETYTADSHIVFSEKIFRCLQIPRPWLLYCSPGSIDLLQTHGFDVLADCVDTNYDKITNHGVRLNAILDQLETFVSRQYSDVEYARFEQAAQHNRHLLEKFARSWPNKLDLVMTEIQQL